MSTQKLYMKDQKQPYIKLILPFPPSTNAHWRYSQGRVFLSDQSKAFIDEVFYSIHRQRLAIKINEPVKLIIVLHPKNNQKRDIDNFGTKALLDAMTHAGVWKDDSLVKQMLLAWGENSKKPYVDLAILFCDGDYHVDIDSLLDIYLH